MGDSDQTLPHEVVVQELDKALDEPRVKIIMQAMNEAGCPIARSYFHVMDCKMEAGGGYAPKLGIILCRDQLRSTRQVHSTVLHELVHAYDDCVAKPGGLNWDDCHAHACTEVRAAHLSGDCDWAQEAWRGNVSAVSPSTWRGYHQRCVARRAALSLALNPKCQEPGCAQSVVQEVMHRCMQDKAPFAAPAAGVTAEVAGAAAT